MSGLRFDIRSNAREVIRHLSILHERELPRAMLAAADRTGRAVFTALRMEMQEEFDRPTPWILRGLKYKKPTLRAPLVRIWLEEFGSPGQADVLRPEIEGGKRRHKRFERALIAKGLMSPLAYAVPGRQAPLDQYGNVPGSFIVRMLSDLQAFGEEGYRANRRGKRRGRRKTNYFFVPRPGSSLKPGVYWHMPGGLLGVVFAFVSGASYERRYDFYGKGVRAYERVASRYLGEELARVRLHNRR
jgi:hypothetical protein